MLFVIDCSIKKHLEKVDVITDLEINIIKSLKYLMRASISQRHIVIFDEMLDAIYFSINFKNSINDMELLNFLEARSSRFYELKSLTSIFSEYVVVKSPEYDFLKIKEDSINIYEVPITYCNDTTMSRTRFISESPSDCNFYRMLTKIFINENSSIYESIHLNAGNENGGGSTIGEVYSESIIQNNEITLAIVDSDKKYLNGEAGNTSKSLTNTHELLKAEKIKGIFSNLILSVSEKENLVPPSGYILDEAIQHRVNMNILIELENDPELSNILRFFDYKNGINNQNYEEENFRSFYEPLLTRYPNIRCCENNGIIVKGFGRSIIKGFVSSMDEYYSNNKIPNYLKSDIEAIAKKIISWCCVGKPHTPV